MFRKHNRVTLFKAPIEEYYVEPSKTEGSLKIKMNLGLVSIVAIICFSILIFLCTCMICISFILRRIKNDNENQPKESCERSCVEPSFTGQSISVSRTRRSYIPRRYSSGQRSKRSVQKSDYSRTRSQLHTPSGRRCSDISVTDSRNEPNQNRMSYSNN